VPEWRISIQGLLPYYIEIKIVIEILIGRG